MHVRNLHTLKRGRLSVAMFVALTVPFSGAVFAQDSDENVEEKRASETATLDKVTVVGSRIKRSEVEGPAPVVVITRADIDREGFQTVGDMLQTLTQNTSGSFTGDLAVTGFTPNAQVVNLRGMGPGYTLTLINGRRPAMYPVTYNRDNNIVNVRVIPSSIVERVEVLTGGASAIYGSDAVAGVVNIVLRENYDGQQLRLNFGTTQEGGGDSGSIEYTGGAAGDRWSAVWAAQFGAQEPVFAFQRDFMADNRNGPLGPDFTNPSLALAILGTNAGVTSPTTSLYFDQAACDRFGYHTKTTAPRGTYCGSYTASAQQTIQNKDRFYSAYGYGTFDITNSTQLFASATYYSSKSMSSSGTEFWGTQNDPFTVTSTGSNAIGYYDPQFGAITFLQRVFNPFEIGGPMAAGTDYDESTFEVSGGILGTIADRFDYDFSLAYSEYDYVTNRPKLFAKAAHDYFLGPQQGWHTHTNGQRFPIYTLNLDRYMTPWTPEIRDSLTAQIRGEAETTSATANFTISGDLFELPAGSVGFAGVLEWNRQTVDMVNDPRLDPTRPLDDQSIFGLTSSGETHGERDRFAVGAEFRIPILDSLTAQFAARYDDYDDITDVGSAVSTMAGLEWRPFDSLLLRGSYSTSFRAPDMQMVFAGGSGGYSTVIDQYACRAGVGVADGEPPRNTSQCNVAGDPTIYQILSVVAGNQYLEEEKGESFTAGFVWDIIDNMSVTVDYYRIKLEDQALFLSAAVLLADEANCRLGKYPNGDDFPNPIDSAYCQGAFNLVERGGDGVTGRINRVNSAYINAALSDTSGIDASYRYRLNTDRFGTFNLDLNYSLVLTDKYKRVESDPLVDYRDDPSLYNTRSRVRGSLGWQKDDWSATVFGTRWGTIRNSAGADFTNAAGDFSPLRLPPYMLYNLTIGKKFGPNVQTQFTVVNVLDNKFRNDPSATGFPFFNIYGGSSPLGRSFFGSISYRF